MLLLHRNLVNCGILTPNSRSECNSKGDPLHCQWFAVVGVCWRQLSSDLKAHRIMAAAVSSERSLPFKKLCSN